MLGLKRDTLDAARTDSRHSVHAGRPAVERRHRHLCEGQRRKPRRRRRSRQRRACASTAGICAARSSAKAAISASRSAAASSTRCATAARPQHRLRRQLRRRRLLGPRSQHQDPAEQRCRSAPGSRSTKRNKLLVAHDRRSGAPGAARQLPAEPGAVDARSARQSRICWSTRTRSARWSCPGCSIARWNSCRPRKKSTSGTRPAAA